MRTVRRVIVCLLVLSAAGVWAQQATPAEGSVDSSVTVMGRDDSVIPVPPPEDPLGEIVLPPLDSESGGERPDSTPQAQSFAPPVSPPVADIFLLPRDTVLAPDQPRARLE